MNDRDRSVATFTGLGHGTMHGYEFAIPVFVPLWLAEFGVSATTLGAVAAVGFAMIGGFAPVAGALADRWGSRRLVLVSIAGMGLAFGALALVETVIGLAAVLLCWGLAASLYHPAGLSLISRSADRRGTVLALHGVGGNVGTVVIPVLAVVLLAIADWRSAALGLAVVATLPLLAGVVLPIAEPRHGTDSAGWRPTAYLRSVRSLVVGAFALLLAVQLLYGTYYRGVVTFLPDVLGSLAVFEALAIGSLDLETAQIAYMVLLLVGAVGQYAGGVASDRVRPERVLVVILLVLAALGPAFIGATALGAMAVLAICALLGLFLFAVAPVGQHLVAEYTPEGSHGTSFGVVYFGIFGVGAVGAALAGALLDGGGLWALFGGLGIVVLFAAGLAAVLLVRYGRDRHRFGGSPARA